MTSSSRPSGRQADQMRHIELIARFSPYAEGSCLAKFGNTHVLVTAMTKAAISEYRQGRERNMETLINP